MQALMVVVLLMGSLTFGGIGSEQAEAQPCPAGFTRDQDSTTCVASPHQAGIPACETTAVPDDFSACWIPARRIPVITEPPCFSGTIDWTVEPPTCTVRQDATTLEREQGRCERTRHELVDRVCTITATLQPPIEPPPPLYKCDIGKRRSAGGEYGAIICVLGTPSVEQSAFCPVGELDDESRWCMLEAVAPGDPQASDIQFTG